MAILILPFTVTVIVPALLLVLSFCIIWPWILLYPLTGFSILIGSIPFIVGLIVLYKTNRVFARIGRGTLAPWAPTQQFITVGLYQYMRNPMIVGVLLVLLGEAIAFGSLLILLWFVFFFVMNHLWFVHWEEPDLERRFGEKYRTYKTNVPRWIPRRRPWRQELPQQE